MSFTGPAVPGNAIQRRLRQSDHHAQRPDAWSADQKRGVIAKAWDRTTREEQGVPAAKRALLARHPGMVLCEVLLLNGEVVIAPLGISHDLTQAVYGNAANLVGRPVSIEYYTHDMNYGKVYLDADDLNRSARDDELSSTYDIGGIYV